MTQADYIWFRAAGIFLALFAAAWFLLKALANRRRLFIESPLSPDVCKQRLVTKREDGESEIDADALHVRIHDERVTCFWRPTNDLREAFLKGLGPDRDVQFLYPWSPVVFDATVHRTASGTMVEGHFRMLRFVFAMMVALCGMFGVILSVFAAELPSADHIDIIVRMAVALAATVAFLAFSRLSGSSERAEILAAVLRRLDATMVDS